VAGPLHTGRGTNAIYRALIFVVGFLPPLFAFTGVAMWWVKRRARAMRVAAVTRYRGRGSGMNM